jgi:hypothetical protein
MVVCDFFGYSVFSVATTGPRKAQRAIRPGDSKERK